MQTALAEDPLRTEPVEPLTALGTAQMVEPTGSSDAPKSRAADLIPYDLDPTIASLVDLDRHERNALVKRIRSHDHMLAAGLYWIGTAPDTEPEARGRAVEILASARARWLEPFVVQLILELLDSADEDLRFAAVAASSDISVTKRVALVAPLRRLAETEPCDDVRRAARAFLRAHER